TAEQSAGISHHKVGAGAANLLGYKCKIEYAAARSADVFRKWQPVEARLYPGIEQFLRICLFAIDPRHILWCCDPLHQLAHAVAKEDLFFAEGKIQLSL